MYNYNLQYIISFSAKKKQENKSKGTKCFNFPRQQVNPLQTSLNECACANWQNWMATNWSQQVKTLAWRSALCSLTILAKSGRWKRSRIWLKIDEYCIISPGLGKLGNNTFFIPYTILLYRSSKLPIWDRYGWNWIRPSTMPSSKKTAKIGSCGKWIVNNF